MQGKDLAEVEKAAEEVRDKATFLVLLDTIQHVYRTGRIPKVASQIGYMLNVKRYSPSPLDWCAFREW